MPKKGTCKAEQCERPVRAKGYCDRHYRKWRKGLMGKPRYRTCTHADCRKPRVRKSLCEQHWAEEYGKRGEEAAEATG